MKYFLFMAFAAVFTFSCKKQNIEEPIDNDFVKGEVLVGIDSSVQVERLFFYVNSLNVSIGQITGYLYTTTIPKDSIAYIKTILNLKPYINTQHFSASVWPDYQTNIVHNSTILWNMTIPNQQDYIQTKNSLRMIDKLSPTKNMLIKVPIGKEIYWKNQFKTRSWVTWADLNWIGEIQPF